MKKLAQIVFQNEYYEMKTVIHEAAFFQHVTMSQSDIHIFSVKIPPRVENDDRYFHFALFHVDAKLDCHCR